MPLVRTDLRAIGGLGGIVIALLVSLVAATTASALPVCPDHSQVKVVSDGHGSLESIGVDKKGRIFFTDSPAGQLLMIRKPGAEPKVVADGIDAPGGIVFQNHSGNVLVGFGDSIAQAGDGTLNPEAGLLRVNPKTGETTVHTEGLQMANGVARGPGRAIYASNDITGGIDRVRSGSVLLNWAPIASANGMIADNARGAMFVNQTFVASAIQRVPFDDPSAAETYWSAPPSDAAGGLDGLTQDGEDRLFAAANGAGEVWRVDGPDDACAVAELDPFPSGPSDLAFGRRGSGFSPHSLFVVTFGGELLELRRAR